MFRFLIIALFLVIFLLIAIPTFIIVWLIGKVNRHRRDIISLRFAQMAFHCFIWLAGVELTVLGEENIPDEAALFVGNHRSIFDIILTYTRVKGLTGFVAKKELGNIPVFSNVMGYLYCLFLDRDNIKEGLKTILQAIEYIKQGVSIFIFPEGARNKGEETTLLPFKDGAFKIATKSNCPIVPVALNNTVAIFEKQFPRVKRTKVIIEYGTPIYPDQLAPEHKRKIGNYVAGIIEQTLQKNALLIGETK